MISASPRKAVKANLFVQFNCSGSYVRCLSTPSGSASHSAPLSRAASVAPLLIARRLWTDQFSGVPDGASDRAHSPPGTPRSSSAFLFGSGGPAEFHRRAARQIWVVGADSWRNPDEDLPADFEQRRSENYGEQRKPLDPSVFISDLRSEMTAALDDREHRNPRPGVARHHRPRIGGRSRCQSTTPRRPLWPSDQHRRPRAGLMARTSGRPGRAGTGRRARCASRSGPSETRS